MISFSVLVTNSRNGGQHELLVDANNAVEAEQHVNASRPHYIVKKVWVAERKFVCHGWNSRHERYEALAYMAFSAKQAAAVCHNLHPDFFIDRVLQEENYATA
jgi:hypothetical protein